MSRKTDTQRWQDGLRHILTMAVLLTNPEGFQRVTAALASILPPEPTDREIALAHLQLWHNRG